MTSQSVSNSAVPSKVELTWDQVASGDYPVTPAQQLFYTVVLATAAKAKARMPEANGRIERARDLVLGGLVQPGPAGSFTVRSQSARGKSYTITEGVCPCPDAEKLTDHRCKHLLATWIWRKARKTLEAQLVSNGQHPEEPPAQASTTPAPIPTPATAVSPATPQASALPACPEAASSINLYLTIGGYKAQLTLRDMDAARLLTRLEAILKRFPAPEAPTKSAAAEPPATPEGWCRRHDLQMTQQHNTKGAWWSHRLADGSWCKGK